MSAGPRRAYINTRLLDPATGLDAKGALLTEGGTIAELGPGLFADGVPEGIETLDCAGHALCPGLIDMRAFLGEPGVRHKETLASASRAAAAGGVTTLIAMPNTNPARGTIPFSIATNIGRPPHAARAAWPSRLGGGAMLIGGGHCD